MKRPMTLILLAGVVLFCTLSGCRTVTFTPVVEGMAYPPKSDNHEIVVLEPAEAGQYDIIGSVSFQDSALSHMWNGWQDLKSLGEELEFENIERLMEKVREVGGDALIGLQHEGMIGQGPTRAHTTGVATDVTDSVSVGVSSTTYDSDPEITIISYADVGRLK